MDFELKVFLNFLVIVDWGACLVFPLHIILVFYVCEKCITWCILVYYVETYCSHTFNVLYTLNLVTS